MAAITRTKTRRINGQSKACRFDARLNDKQKVLIQEAAAERTIKQRGILTLSVRETEAFVNAILNPAAPGPVLRAAARDYKKNVGR